MKNHVIIVGWDGFSERVFRELNRSEVTVAVATENQKAAIEDRYGEIDGLEILEVTSFDAVGELAELDAADAAQFFVNVESDDEKLLRVVDLTERPEWDGDIDVVLENEQLKETFEDAGVRYAVSRRDVSSRLLASHIYEPAVAEVSEHLFTATKNGTVDSDASSDKPGSSPDGAPDDEAESDYETQELRVGPECELLPDEPDAEATIGDFMTELRTRFGAMPLACLCDDSGQLDRLPAADVTVRSGDYLLVALSREHEEDVHSLLDVDTEGRLGELKASG